MYTKSQSVGIDKTLSDYVSHIKPNRVNGYVKFLVEDFHVHEIDTNGKLLNLGEFIKFNELKKAIENKKKTQTGQRFLCSYNDTTQVEYPFNLFTEMDKTRMDRLLSSMSDTLRTGTVNQEPHFTLLICKQDEDMKQVRTKVHQWIRTELPFLESKAINFKTCQNNDELRNLLGSYLDFSTLSQDYNLIYISPNALCSKLLNSITYKNKNNNNNEENKEKEELEDNEKKKETKEETENENNKNKNKENNKEEDKENNKGEEETEEQEKETEEIKEEQDTKEEKEQKEETKEEKQRREESLDEMIKRLDMTDYDTYNAKSYGRFLHFNMLKINRETSEVVNMMCKTAKRASFDFFSAGNKDKRGITVQRLCIRRCTIPDLLEAMSKSWFKDVYLSDFCYKNYKIGLGDLSGNHFKIVIRGIEDASKVHQSIQTLKSHGFINYFGLQRFGTKIVGTHMVGAAIIDQRHELALRLILGDIDSAKEYNLFKKYFNNIDGMKLSLNTEYNNSNGYYSNINNSEYNNSNGYHNNINNNEYNNINNINGYYNNNCFAYPIQNNYNLYNSNGYNMYNNYNTPFSYNGYNNSNGYYNSNTDGNNHNSIEYINLLNNNQYNSKENNEEKEEEETVENRENEDTKESEENNNNNNKEEEKDVMCNKFKRAIDYYLFDNDPETALKYLPSHLFIEKSLLKGIVSNLSFDKCLERVPKNILSIYVHSTQSVLFNLAATERLNRYGHKVVVGDLVVTSGEDLSGSLDSDDSEDLKTTTKKRMQVLEVNTEEEAERYTIEEVVLPLPGDNIIYPQNMKDYYNKISMENFNIPLDNFSTYKNVNGNKIKGLVSVSGSYRFLIVKPKDVTFKIIDKLQDPFEILIKPEIEDYEENLEIRETPRNLEKIKSLAEQIKNKSALVLTCSLPKSSYITVALREILTDESIENNHK